MTKSGQRRYLKRWHARHPNYKRDWQRKRRAGLRTKNAKTVKILGVTVYIRRGETQHE